MPASSSNIVQRAFRRALRLLPGGEKLHTRIVFDEIYREGRWGRDGDDGFNSGSGSHRDDIVVPYVTAVSAFLDELGTRASVLDLGCGDFNVGRQIRPHCDRYIACDIVDALIERNRQRFGDLDVEFRCLDLVSDPWPKAEVVFIRQVLQHLNNKQIAQVIRKLPVYRHVVVTEHIPADDNFTPNGDKTTGEHIRMQHRPPSGVVLHAPPFELGALEQRVLCSVAADGGLVQTTLYRFA